MGLMAYAQTEAWVTKKPWPAMIMSPSRGAPVLAEMKNWTTPGPVPLAPEVMVIQPSLLAAVQEQPAAVVTFTLPVPPEGEKL